MASKQKWHGYVVYVVCGICLVLACGVLALQPVAAKQVNLTIHGWFPLGSADSQRLGYWLREYERLNPHVKIEDQGQVIDWTKIQTLIAGGMLPDIMSHNSDVIRDFYEQGLLSPMPPDIRAKAVRYIYPTTLAGTSLLSGEIAGMPIQNSTSVMYLNLQKMGEMGLPASAPDTWDQFTAWARRSTRYNDRREIVQPGAYMQGWNWGFDFYGLAMLFAYGGQVINEKNEIVIHQKPLLDVIDVWQGWYTDIMGQNGLNPSGFLSGNSASFLLGFEFDFGQLKNAYPDSYRTDFKVGLTPAGPAGRHAVQWTSAFGVPNGPNAAEAWKLLDWLFFSKQENGLTPIGDIMYNRGVPPMHREDIGPLLNRPDGPFLAAIADNLAYAGAVVNNWTRWYQDGIRVRPLIGNQVLRVFKGEISPLQAAENLKAELENRRTSYKEQQAQLGK